jgi:hypothetical protein
LSSGSQPEHGAVRKGERKRCQVLCAWGVVVHA